eukprot:7495098-Ditylum_brightwellii.AAC.1
MMAHIQYAMQDAISLENLHPHQQEMWGARPGSSVWSSLYYTICKPPFSTAKLANIDYSVDFSKLTNENDQVAVIDTKPLTVDEHRKEFKQGQLLMFNNGLPYLELYDCDEVEQQGH